MWGYKLWSEWCFFGRFSHPCGPFHFFCFASFEQEGHSELQESTSDADTNPVLHCSEIRWKHPHSELLWESNTLLGPEVAGCPASHNLASGWAPHVERKCYVLLPQRTQAEQRPVRWGDNYMQKPETSKRQLRSECQNASDAVRWR